MEGVSWIIDGSLELYLPWRGKGKNLGKEKYLEPKFSAPQEEIIFRASRVKKVKPDQLTLSADNQVADFFLLPFDEFMNKLRLKTEFFDLSTTPSTLSSELELAQQPTLKKSPECKIWYVRYRNKFLVGVSGSYSDTVLVQNSIKDFINKKVSYTLKEKITNLVKNNHVEFLGYYIKNNPFKLTKQFNTELIVPKKVIKELLISQGLANQEGKGKYVGKWICLPDAEIIQRFINIVRGLVEYYKIGKNRNKNLNEGIYIIKFSLLHTLAAKHRMKISQVLKKYKIEKVFPKLAVKLDCRNCLIC
jgi:hypothetical protein